MAIKRVWISDETPCTICHLCETLAPEVFEVSEITAWVKPGRTEGPFETPTEDKIKEAGKACPVEIVCFEEEG